MPVTQVAIDQLPRKYPHLDQIDDWAVVQTVRLLWDQTFELREQLTAAQATITELTTAHNDTETATATAQKAADEAMAVAQSAERSAQAQGASGGGGGGGGLPGGGDGGQAAAGFAAPYPTGHPGGAVPLTAFEFGRIVGGVRTEWNGLLQVAPDQPTRDANTTEFLLRVIWHVQQAGFTAGRQQNPSMTISGDKLTVQVDGVLRAYDIMSLNPFSVPVTVQITEVAPPAYLADGGQPD